MVGMSATSRARRHRTGAATSADRRARGRAGAAGPLARTTGAATGRARVLRVAGLVVVALLGLAAEARQVLELLGVGPEGVDRVLVLQVAVLPEHGALDLADRPLERQLDHRPHHRQGAERLVAGVLVVDAALALVGAVGLVLGGAQLVVVGDL